MDFLKSFDDADFPPQDTHSIPQVFSFTIREINHAVRINYVKNIHKSHIKSNKYFQITLSFIFCDRPYSNRF